MFIERGFDNTTIDDIARAAGIGRRTFFRYFPSKNDVAWGDFDGLLKHMRGYLAAVPASVPLMDALREAVIDFNTVPAGQELFHRQRMTLLLTVPSLIAHANLRYAEWRQVVAEFAAARLKLPIDTLSPQVIGWTLLSLSLAAYEQWLTQEDAELTDLLQAAFAVLPNAFGLFGGRQ